MSNSHSLSTILKKKIDLFPCGVFFSFLGKQVLTCTVNADILGYSRNIEKQIRLTAATFNCVTIPADQIANVPIALGCAAVYQCAHPAL